MGRIPVLIGKCFCVLNLTFFLCRPAAAIETQTRHEITGTVSFVNAVLITLVYGQDKVEGVEKEMTLYKNEDVRYFNRYRWEDIKAGDHLRVVLEDSSEPEERVKPDGSFEMINRVTKRRIVEIYFPDDGTKSLAS